MIFGPVVINGRDSLPRLSRKITKLHYTQTFQVIVPPIEPPPKRRRELPIRHRWTHDVEPFGRFDGFIQISQHSMGLLREGAARQLPASERNIQSAQFVDQAKAGDEKRDFGCVTQKLLFLLGPKV